MRACTPAGPARSPAAAGNARSRSQTLVVPPASAVGGHKFRRQAPIGPFVADFVCLAARLVLEIDGPAHDARWERDEKRDRWFHAQGLPGAALLSRRGL